MHGNFAAYAVLLPLTDFENTNLLPHSARIYGAYMLLLFSRADFPGKFEHEKALHWRQIPCYSLEPTSSWLGGDDRKSALVTVFRARIAGKTAKFTKYQRHLRTLYPRLLRRTN